MSAAQFEVKPIGRVESLLSERTGAPRQGDEGAPDAWLVFEPAIAAGLAGLEVGAVILLFTWLHEAERDVLEVHPRGNVERGLRGVFSTRSPDRPNPIGLHRVEILAIEGLRFHVRHLEAIDGTPIIDVKPLLHSDPGER
jgi:tRNA-Thr(GGU) m(6)t(6)A37 methyltransferase TsaA